MVKRCPRCGQEHPLTAFNRDRSRKDGLTHWCKSCIHAYQYDYDEKQRQKRQEAREKGGTYVHLR